MYKSAWFPGNGHGVHKTPTESEPKQDPEIARSVSLIHHHPTTHGQEYQET